MSTSVGNIRYFNQFFNQLRARTQGNLIYDFQEADYKRCFASLDGGLTLPQLRIMTSQLPVTIGREDRSKKRVVHLLASAGYSAVNFTQQMQVIADAKKKQLNERKKK
jgi:hypothetical protein